MAKTMCWEYMNCDREKDNSCPAVTELAGRNCWLVAGTMCGGTVQGTAAKKIGNCRQCDFYQKVKAREI
jgi:methyl-accepting chemotaxis protein